MDKQTLLEIKLEAIASRHYQGIKWQPKVGDWYTIDRNDLELFEIVGETDVEWLVNPRTEGHSGDLHFEKLGFTDKDFGVHRCKVLDYRIKSLTAAPQSDTGEDDSEAM